MKIRTIVFGAVGLGVVAVAFAQALKGSLSIGGSSVDTDFVMKNGRTYVPLADVAKALKMTITKTPGGFDLSPEGGANQVQGQTGKVGDVLSAGWCTVKVNKVIVTDKYQRQFVSGEITPYDDTKTLVVVVLQVKNAMKQAVYMDPFGFEETALVDNDGHAYQSVNGLDCDISDRGPKLLPGSAFDFALVFYMPKTEKATELVYSPNFMGEHVPKKSFRISLADKS